MSAQTKIEWTDTTWNPIRGCSKVSAGCERCYAMQIAARFSGPGQPYEGLAKRNPVNWTGQVRLVPELLEAPLKWRKPRRVFVNSMSDLFHDSIPEQWIYRIFATMARCPQHTFQVLTKRAKRMAQWMQWMANSADPERRRGICAPVMTCASDGWPLPNVWLGVSVEDQATADERIPRLLQTPAAVRFVSCEPLLGPVDLSTTCINPSRETMGLGGPYMSAAHAGIDWVIAGGESGPGARPCDADWIRSIVQQCRRANVPCFVKQMGTGLSAHNAAGRGRFIRDGDDPAEWPADLRVRQFPGSERNHDAAPAV